MGVKGEVEKSLKRGFYDDEELIRTGGEDAEQDVDQRAKGKGENKWVEMTIEIPGFRDDDALPIFVAAMLNEALLSTGDLPDKLYINDRWHWKLCIDVCFMRRTSSFPFYFITDFLLFPLDSPTLSSSLAAYSSPLANNLPCPPLHPPSRTNLGPK